ncbi:uncharacterized protein LOC124178035 isoform X1 [Neodiprion fabricii]|uniref:uncharacterized protein LOC124178035 isoform X1 n=1 Tax=Neodiprion fabricii TaxID=2872261 RepID=UPI001ED93066|nr:uncharacterized protein LOC124178035 isoform X1 [Neodiprion fabricii]XP_046417068.1 uncharacterized protein LOC124178035 isoform X1 [Neodiprion fabricii]
MMAGSGVNLGGTAMLRTRRRDISIKPNRRLDRKSSRGMIYENEELRLRTININAEVEQGQNDIKKLRRENEQLRREIWSLRDEYDKLEELVKSQSAHGSSDELEGRSGEDDNPDDSYAEYSGDENVADEEEEEEEVEEEDEEEVTTENGRSHEERLDNAENQKISASEKMNSGSLHRLHVEFDDLSIVDEEEELKKDKDKKEPTVASTDEGQATRESEVQKTPSDQSQDGAFRYFPSTFDLQLGTLTAAERQYFNDCPFVFPNTSDPNYPKMVMSPRPTMYNGHLTPLPNLDTPGIGHVDSIFGPTVQTQESSVIPSLPQRRNIRFKQPVRLFKDPFCKNPSSGTSPNSCESVGQNGWDFGVRLRDQVNESSAPPSSADKPKHFFAPLPSKMRTQRSPEHTTTTGTSSSSDKTSSTVVSRNHVIGKGTADVYVSGGYPLGGDREGQPGAFVTSEDLLIEGAGNIACKQGSGNPLVKSLSCQDLSSDPQSLPFAEKLKMFNAENLVAKSDNTLDAISNTPRPYKSQLNVTLKLPKPRVPSSPDTPEIPRLPTINYRLFNNPFLQSFEQECKNYKNYAPVESPITRPLSVQVSEAVPPCNPVNGYSRGQNQLESDSRMLLMAANQFRNLESDANTGVQSTPRLPPLGFEVTSFEGPNPQSQRLYHGPIVFPGGISGAPMVPRMVYEGANRVPAQTQTSIDGDSHVDETQDNQTPGSPVTLRRKRTLRKERSGSIKDKRPLSPAAQRRKDRLRKQSSVTSSTDPPPESPAKTSLKSRKLSVTTTSEPVDKNESRSSSSGQDSPKKAEQRRRVSLYFNAKKRPSIVTTRTDRRSSVESSREGRFSLRREALDATTTNSERERTNSVSSRDTVSKGRKLSTGSDKVPWCACWGNGCV